MKKIFVLFLFSLVLFLGVHVNTVYATDIVVYSVTTSSEEWRTFKSREEMVDATRISPSKLEEMSNQELVKAILDYPLLGDLIAHNDNEIAFKQFYDGCDAYRELVDRKGGVEELHFELINLPADEILKT
ncbi:MAG: hypothetical protein ABH890_03940 [Bacillota bacterium]